MRVWIYSPYRLFEDALELLLRDMGFSVSPEGEAADVALWDLSAASPPYPQPPQVATLAITAGSEGEAISLLRQRYRGYVTSVDDAGVLRRALEAVRRGEIWADRQLLTRALDSFATPQLTLKEQEVFRLLSKGLSNRAIALQLGVVEGTIKMHVSHIFAKLGTRSRAELIAHLHLEDHAASLLPVANTGAATEKR